MIRTILLAAALASFGLAARAEDRIDKLFDAMDTEHHGYISPEDFSINKGKVLYEMDANHDGKIEQNETRMSPDQFARYAGADGTIEGVQFFLMPQTKFEAFDTDGDKKISRAEFRRHIMELRGAPQSAASGE